MRIVSSSSRCGGGAASSLPFVAFHRFLTSRRGRGIIIASKAKLSDSSAKRAKLSARKKERIKLPSYINEDGSDKMYHISEFLSHPSGVETILNTNALQSFQSLGSNTYRCTLPQIQLMKFEVAPTLHLRVASTDEGCLVEMLSCKFEGSEVVEKQNEHFSASMTNHITWCTIDSESFLDVDVQLNLTLEVYTKPFSMLPISTVESPGNLMMQALVDRLVPLLLQQLLQDYDNWVSQQSADNSRKISL
ncbi:hypothetical protein LguiA_033622 [Lonicera macranthoides]